MGNVNKPSVQYLVIDDLRGGRLRTQDTLTNPDNTALEVSNVEWVRSNFGERRPGSNSMTIANGNFTNSIAAMFRHVPNADDTKAELWMLDFDGKLNRAANTGNATHIVCMQPTIAQDTITGTYLTSCASLGGLLGIANPWGASTRFHVWDGTSVRRAGLAAPANNFTVQDQGSGSYAATPRYYRFRMEYRDGSDNVLRRSEPSGPVTFTPNGSSQFAKVNVPSGYGDVFTHYVVEASPDGANYFVVSQFANSVSFLLDGTTAATYAALTATDPVGTYTLPPAARYVASDDNRFLFFGDQNASGVQNRIYFSGIVGATGVGNAERCRVTNAVSSYFDLDEKDSGRPTGILGADGQFFAFKTSQVWLLTKSGNADNPYDTTKISPDRGAIPRSMCAAQDASGSPAVYWMSAQGPYRYGANGLEFIGEGVEDLILGPVATLVNASSSTDSAFCHSLYVPDRSQVMFFCQIDQSGLTWLILVYHIKTGGWSTRTGSQAVAWCSVMFSETLGTSMGMKQSPYIGRGGAANSIWKLNTTNGTDAGDAFTARIFLKDYAPWGLHKNGTIVDSYIRAQRANSATLNLSVVGGSEGTTQQRTANANVSLAGAVSTLGTSLINYVRKKVTDAHMADVPSVSFIIGDPSDTANAAWNITALVVGYEVGADG